MQDSPIALLDRLEAEVGRLDRERLRAIREIDISEEWDYGEYRDIVHWIAARCQITWIDAKRRVEAAHAIEQLPLVSEALEVGGISLDKTVQLTRFAQPDTEGKLLKWAKSVSLKCVRETADAWQRPDIDDVRKNDRLRNFGWRPIEGGTAFSFFGALPAEQGAVVAKAIDRVAEGLENLPHEEVLPESTCEPAETLPRRRADALVMLASQRVADDFDADRATIIVHAPAESLAGGRGACELEGASLLHPKVVERLACDARIQAVVEDGKGEPIGVGHTTRVVPPWLKRLVRHRDRGCVFPGCEDMRYNEAHHIWHWTRGGPTDLDNLVLVCGFHHKAVHEFGWSVSRRADGVVEWFRPSGILHAIRLPVPKATGPPPSLRPRQQELLAVS